MENVFKSFLRVLKCLQHIKWSEMRVHRQQHSFQTVYKKIKSQSNNPCACQDRTKQTHQNFAMYIFILLLQSWISDLFQAKKKVWPVTHSQLGSKHLKTWQKKIHWKNDKSSYELNIDNHKTKKLQTYLHWSLTKIETYHPPSPSSPTLVCQML